jgi:hypothetical protein
VTISRQAIENNAIVIILVDGRIYTPMAFGEVRRNGAGRGRYVSSHFVVAALTVSGDGIAPTYNEGDAGGYD